MVWCTAACKGYNTWAQEYCEQGVRLWADSLYQSHTLGLALHPPRGSFHQDEMPLNDLTRPRDLHTHVLFDTPAAKTTEKNTRSRSADSVLNLHYIDLSIRYGPTGWVEYLESAF